MLFGVPYKSFSKRAFDLTVGAALLMLCLPIMLCIAALIKLDSSGPMIFSQTRLGQHKRPFRIFKFRTMYHHSACEHDITVGNDSRITKIGKLLRQYRLDELPQLFNVLRGEMSIVGPRPLVPGVAEHFPREFEASLKVKPGITGLAAIKYYHHEEERLAKAEDPKNEYFQYIMPIKLRYDELYVAKQSIRLDVLIIWWTFAHFAKKALLQCCSKR